MIDPVEMFKQKLTGIGGVVGFKWRHQPERLVIDTYITEPSEAIENRIYEAELAVMDAFPEEHIEWGVTFVRKEDLR